jgi:hypothetical protein
MCSIVPPSAHPGDLTARIGQAIDELAAAATKDSPSGSDFAKQLAAAWAVIAAADPELARLAAHYSD